MTKEIIIGTNTLLQMAKQMKDRGEISNGDYACMELRNRYMDKDHKENIIILR